MEVVTLWLAVDDSTSENGCMRVIPGSHKSELAPILPRTDIANALSSGMDESLVDSAKATDVVLWAGDVSIHHPNIVHGSNSNFSDRRRCGLTIRYIPTTIRILTGGTSVSQAHFCCEGNPFPASIDITHGHDTTQANTCGFGVAKRSGHGHNLAFGTLILERECGKFFIVNGGDCTAPRTNRRHRGTIRIHRSVASTR
jgi:phytanoyl-CoA dioxygenase PhyH